MGVPALRAARPAGACGVFLAPAAPVRPFPGGAGAAPAPRFSHAGGAEGRPVRRLGRRPFRPAGGGARRQLPAAGGGGGAAGPRTGPQGGQGRAARTSGRAAAGQPYASRMDTLGGRRRTPGRVGRTAGAMRVGDPMGCGRWPADERRGASRRGGREGGAAVCRGIGEPGGPAGRAGRMTGVSPARAFVLTAANAIGTLRPCAWGVPWPSCVPSDRNGSRYRPPQICASFCTCGGSPRDSTHPTAWVGDVPG